MLGHIIAGKNKHKVVDVMQSAVNLFERLCVAIEGSGEGNGVYMRGGDGIRGVEEKV